MESYRTEIFDTYSIQSSEPPRARDGRLAYDAAASGRGATRMMRSLCLGLIVALAACGGEPRPQVLVIGLDGADWQILDPLLAQGRLPHLARLKQHGVCGPLQTLTDLPISPVIWTSIATGRVPAAHGITWFLVDAPDGRRIPVQSDNRRVPALWNLLAAAGRESVVIGWWATAPAEDVGSSVIVSDALGYHGFGRSGHSLADSRKVHPAELFDPLCALVPPLQQIDFPFARRFFHLTAEEYYSQAWSPALSPEPDPQNPVHLFQQYASTTLGYTAIARTLLAERPFDLCMVYYESTDSLAHLFMKHAAPRLPWIAEAEFERYRHVVDEWYEFVDERVGELLEAMPEGTSVVVLSDHGFRVGDERPRAEATVDLHGAHLDHDPLGVWVASGPLFRRGGNVEGATVLDVAPTLLHALGLEVPRSMDGRVLAEVFEPGFLEKHPVRYGSSLSADRAGSADSAHVADGAVRVNGAGRADRAGAPAALPYDESLEDRALAQLRALGYVSESEESDRAVQGAAPSSPEIHNNRGRLLLRDGDLDGAVREFQQALGGGPADAEALVNLGLVHLARGERERALQRFSQALQHDPNHVPALLRLADLRAIEGEFLTAESLYRQALAIDARLPETFVSLGDTLNRQDRLAEAAEVLQHALELDPLLPKAHYNLGVVRMRQGQMDAACSCYRNVVAQVPGHPFALNNLGHILMQQGDPDGAIDCFKRAAEANPRHVESRFNLGSLLLRRGQTVDALRWLEEALELDPALEPAQLLAAKAHLLNGDLAEARRRLEALIRMFPGNAAGCVELARLCLREGKSDEFVGWLRHALLRGGAALCDALSTDVDFAGVDLEEVLSSGG